MLANRHTGKMSLIKAIKEDRDDFLAYLWSLLIKDGGLDSLSPSLPTRNSTTAGLAKPKE